MTTLAPLVSVNGILGAQISPLDRGFAYGDGVFETCLLQAGHIPLWHFHCERLLSSCARLALPVDIDLLTHYLSQLLAIGDAQNGVLKITITRGTGGRGYRLPESTKLTYCIAIFPSSGSVSNQAGVQVRVCRQTLAEAPNLAGIKHLNRLENVLARAEWQDNNIAEGFMLTEAGQLIEATASNIFIVQAGCLLTPDLSRAGVAGIMRAVILTQLAPTLNLTVKIIPLTLADLNSADEVFVCNSVFGIWPVLGITGIEREHFLQGPITRRLQQALAAYLAQERLPLNMTLNATLSKPQ